MKTRLRALVNDPVAPILRMRDSLLLTEEQVDSVETIQARFQAESDSLLAPIVEYVTEHAGKVKDKEVTKLIGKVMPKMMKLMLGTAKEAGAVLDDEQRTKEPAFVKDRSDSKDGGPD